MSTNPYADMPLRTFRTRLFVDAKRHGHRLDATVSTFEPDNCMTGHGTRAWTCNNCGAKADAQYHGEERPDGCGVREVIASAEIDPRVFQQCTTAPDVYAQAVAAMEAGK